MDWKKILKIVFFVILFIGLILVIYFGVSSFHSSGDNENKIQKDGKDKDQAKDEDAAEDKDEEDQDEDEDENSEDDD